MQSPQSSKEQAAAQVATALHEADVALRALGKALVDDANVHVHSAMAELRQRLEDAESTFELLVNRVPGVGPWVAMELYQRTHADEAEDALATRPSNREEPEEQGSNTAADYLDCIGVHVA